METNLKGKLYDPLKPSAAILQTDQHLFAEWREIKMVPKSLARSLKARGQAGVFKFIPLEYTLNTGHVSFFYDKGAYLERRYKQLTEELQKRGVNFNPLAVQDADNVFLNLPCEFQKEYTPTKKLWPQYGHALLSA